MKTLKRPLVLVTTLIVASLLLSWKYFDEDATYSNAFAPVSNKDRLTDEELIAWMADNAGEQQQEDDQPPAAEDVLVQRIPGNNAHLLLMAYYSKENYSKPSLTIENGYPITLRDDGNGDDKVAGDGLYTAKISPDIAAFRKLAISMVQEMKSATYKPVSYFDRQRIIDPDAAESFDIMKFDANQPVSISGLTNALSSDFRQEATTQTSNSASAAINGAVTVSASLTTLDSIKKNSILITSLAVVEDPTRTWNSCAQ